MEVDLRVLIPGGLIRLIPPAELFRADCNCVRVGRQRL